MKINGSFIGVVLVATVALTATPSLAPAQTGWGTALSFDGVDDYVDLPDGVWFTDTFTVEAWVFLRSYKSYCRLFDFGNGPAADNVVGVLSDGTNGRPALAIFQGGSVSEVRCATAIPLNTWTHVTFTRDHAGNAGVYLNAVNWGSAPMPGPNTVVRTNNFLGQSNWPADGYLDAILDEVRVWNFARSAAELQRDMQRSLTGTEAGLAAYWRFNEGAGVTAFDSTANALNGTLMNGPTWVPATIPWNAPTVETLPATDLSLASVTLWGTVNPNGTETAAWFEWGTNTSYGQTTTRTNLGSGTNALTINSVLTGLVAGVTYHYQITASNNLGAIHGGDQAFTAGWFNEMSYGLLRVERSAAAWGDYDNDGNLDILLAGNTGSSLMTRVYRNQGHGGFTETCTNLPGIHHGAVAWGDYDNDGDLDILLTGATGNYPNYSPITRVYRNLGNGVFSDINAGLPGVDWSAVAWGDYDNDGRLDILLSGETGATLMTRVYRNNGDGTFSDINAGLPGVAASAVAWGDYNNDGYLDILLTGETGTSLLSLLYRNNGDGTFSNVNVGLPGVSYGAVAWGDYNNDGYLDILLTGFSRAETNWSQLWISRVYRNNGNGTFSDINAGLPGVWYSAMAWGDYDNDGRLDILLSGHTGSNTLTRIYRNLGNGNFSDINAGLPGIYDGAAAWGDYDNDGDLDILLAGSGPMTRIYRNNCLVSNTPPTAPTRLRVTTAGPEVVFHWDAAADGQTPGAGLSYNVRVGTTPGGSDILATHAAANGLRRLPGLGNAQQGLSFRLRPPTAQVYYWSVQAVDSAWAGSPFAGEKTLSLNFTLADAVPGDSNGDGLVDQNEYDTVTRHYWDSGNQPFMTNVISGGQGRFEVGLTNAAGWNFSVLVSTNLVDWQLLGPAQAVLHFVDPEATNHVARFYRLRWP